jgi:metal-sulfur cluster biosynthetic enzyme
MPTEATVLDALSGVWDPELDEPITELKFISSLRVGGDSVEMRLHLPTLFCALNFALLMAHDAREALLSVPDVREARVFL